MPALAQVGRMMNPPAALAFTPASVMPSSLIAAYDATNSANYTKSGSTLTTLKNLGKKSGTPASFTIGVAPNVTTGLAELNGHDTLTFDNTDNVIIPDGTYFDYTKFTIATVISVDTDGGGTRGICGKWGAFASGAGEFSLQMSGANLFQMLVTPDGSTSTTAATSTFNMTTHLDTPIALIGWIDGTNVNLYVAGGDQVETVSSAFVSTTGFAQAFESGRTFNGNAFLGNCPEQYVWGDDVGASNRDKIAEYFISKFNISTAP